jgi:heme-degrading monooxygenase HmoA
MFARVSTFNGRPENIDQVADLIRAEILPASREMRGFKALISYADRQTGEIVEITVWESEEALRESERPANDRRARTAESSGGEIARVERVDVVVFEL